MDSYGLKDWILQWAHYGIEGGIVALLLLSVVSVEGILIVFLLFGIRRDLKRLTRP